MFGPAISTTRLVLIGMRPRLVPHLHFRACILAGSRSTQPVRLGFAIVALLGLTVTFPLVMSQGSWSCF
jgi:hypothetical protein